MPVYSYKCKSCGYEKDLLFRKRLEEFPDQVNCDKCGEEMEKIFTKLGLIKII